MAFDKTKFTALCTNLAKVDLFGAGPPPVPWEGTPTAAAYRQAIGTGANHVPMTFQTDFASPLSQHAAGVVGQVDDPFIVEALAGAIYQHAPDSVVRPQLRRFLAVISNLYRSFLDQAKRAQIALPAVETVPPLAMFQHKGDYGPYTLPVDAIQELIRGGAGVVAMPSTYRDHPVLWAALAHETGRHDVLHADDGLLDELAAGVRRLFGVSGSVGKKLSFDQFNGLLWAYWMDEAASDVYGLLNIGPAFASNLAAFFAAMNQQAEPNAPGFPILRTDTEDDERGDMDVHPTDILRIHLAIGVIDKLKGLAKKARDQYVKDLGALATLCANGATTVRFRGKMQVSARSWLPINTSLPLASMQDAARKVGGYIASAKLKALNQHSVQEIETWDDGDETAASTIRDLLLAGKSVVDRGDDAQLLAGATLALMEHPSLYQQVTTALNAALDSSYRHDPIWGPLAGDPVYLRLHMAAAGAADLADYVSVAGPSAARKAASKKTATAQSARGRWSKR